jgi:spore germination cell wall hydrolase CwlJ-like protein
VAQQPPQVLQRAQAAIDLARQHPMFDADHYLTKSLLDSGTAPSWTRKLTPVKQVGDHMFFSSTRKRR